MVTLLRPIRADRTRWPGQATSSGHQGSLRRPLYLSTGVRALCYLSHQFYGDITGRCLSNGIHARFSGLPFLFILLGRFNYRSYNPKKEGTFLVYP